MRCSKITIEKRNEILKTKQKYPHLTGRQLGAICGVAKSTALAIVSGKYGKYNEPLKTPKKLEANEPKVYQQVMSIVSNEPITKAEKIKSLLCDLVDILCETEQ